MIGVSLIPAHARPSIYVVFKTAIPSVHRDSRAERHITAKTT
jgi:hypothetical protein